MIKSNETAVADLLASGRGSGEIRLTGTVTRIQRHTTRAGHEWATLTVADGTGRIEARALPRAWASSDRDAVAVGRAVTVTGLINAAGGDGPVEIYCTGLAPAPTVPAAAAATPCGPVAVDPPVTWYADVDLDGAVYPTRTRVDGPEWAVPDSAHLLHGLTRRETVLLDAVHEAGHAVAALAVSAHLHYVLVGAVAHNASARGYTEACGLARGRALAAYCGAGERAADRWLRENGLWTPVRGVAVELEAAGDRRTYREHHPDVSFGGTGPDYRGVHDAADAVLDRYWPAVRAVAAALVEHRRLDGDAIATITGLPNGPRTHADRHDRRIPITIRPYT
ncbi:OB-fold nucleic acid binding domain-containing protein [Kitasatospora sp. NPDC058184]|uniref:OB-fold nucleic acid binding domain-containing protein n=1 Tax=Kitasatospora sp. NPDC058184 TaxID=3346370 RepID=UPI0036DE809F